MATLIQNDQRVQACNDINMMLAEVNVLNRGITEGDHRHFTVSFGRKRSIVLDDAFSDKVVAILRHQRIKRIKDIKAKASKYGVSLTNEELASISDEALNCESEEAVLAADLQDEQQAT